MYIFTPNTLIESAKINANNDELKTKTDYLTAPDSGWIVVGSGGSAPAFGNSWVNYDTATYPACSFRKDAMGYVHLKGLIKNGSPTASSIFTLPVGYRPDRQLHLDIVSNAVHGNIAITAAGAVNVQVGSNIWLSLDGKSFKAEQ